MNENINDLRAHLFAVLAGLRDKDNPMDIERAKAISDVAQVVINSAKVEVDYMKVAGANSGSGFLESQPAALPPGIVGIKTHRLLG
jgi:hypothetical protein